MRYNTTSGVIDNRRVVLIGIIGAGGQADEVASILKSDPLFYAVEEPYVSKRSININSVSDEQKNAEVVVAIGAPAVKKHLVETWGGTDFARVTAESAIIDDTSTLGEGSIVSERVVVTTNVTIGRHVLLNVGCTVSHNSSIDDFSTISPGVNIGGNVSIADGVFVGIGATIINNISIARGVVIGAGAVVTKDILEENAVYAGVPAVKIKENDGWLREI